MRVELVSLLFTSVRTAALKIVPASGVVVAAYVAWSTGSAAAWGLAAASLAGVAARLCVPVVRKVDLDPDARDGASVGGSVWCVSGGHHRNDEPRHGKCVGDG